MTCASTTSCFFKSIHVIVNGHKIKLSILFAALDFDFTNWLFLVAVHCDITVWYMTSVMGTKGSIYLFTPERPRDLSARTPEPAPQEPLSYYVPTDLPLLKLRKTE